jgi:hypothetical protein
VLFWEFISHGLENLLSIFYRERCCYKGKKHWIMMETILTLKAPVTLTLNLFTLKIKRGHLIAMSRQYEKYEDFVINSFQDNKNI